MSEHSYTAPSSILMLDKVLNVFRLDVQRSDISLLGDVTGESTKAYMLNNLFLPVMIVVLWFLLVLLIICLKWNWCNIRGRCCILGGKKKDDNNNNMNELKDENSNVHSAADDVVTIVTLDGFLVRGNIEDKVRYLQLQNQMTLVRNICCFVAILVLCVSLTCMVLVGNFQHSHSSVMKETETMMKYFSKAGTLMGYIIYERNVLVDVNDELIDSIEISSQEGCFDDGIADSASSLSTSLLALTQNFYNSTIQDERQLWDDVECKCILFSIDNCLVLSIFFTDMAGSLNAIVFAIDIHDKLRWISPLFIASVLSVALMAVTSISLFAGTTIAKKNVLKPWHRFLFHFLTCPVGILSSIVLWGFLACLILIGVPLVDFCKGMTGEDSVASGGPMQSVLSILQARGFDDSTFFYKTAENYMEVRMK